MIQTLVWFWSSVLRVSNISMVLACNSSLLQPVVKCYSNISYYCSKSVVAKVRKNALLLNDSPGGALACFLSCKKGVKEESFFSFMICTYYIIFYLFASFMFHKKCQKDVLYLIFKASSMIYFTVDSIRNWSLNLILKMNRIHRNPIFKIHWGQYLGKGHAIFGIRSKAKLSGQHGWIVKWSDFFFWLRETS